MVKRIIFFFSLLILGSPCILYGQTESIQCPMSEAENVPAAPEANGVYKPAKNAPGEYLRSLLVFVQFANDNIYMSNWNSGALPVWANSIIDATPAQNYRQYTISDYFKKMSNGTFDFIGDIYPQLITLPTIKSYSDANADVINILNNQQIDFKKYDNWRSSNGTYSFSARNGDGYLDMLIIVYRGDGDGDNQVDKLQIGGGAIAELGSGVITTHDGIKIQKPFGSLGSGITFNVNNRGYDLLKADEFIAHEYGHYIFGGGHTRVSGIMCGWPNEGTGNTFAMSALERARLGYIPSPTLATTDGYTVTLRDYLTTGDAVKVSIPYGSSSSSEFFIIENHQRKTYLDQIVRGGALEGVTNPNTTIGAGLYIWYVKNGFSNTPDILPICADGSWNYAFAGLINMPAGWPPQMPLLSRATPNKYLNTGKGDRNEYLLNYNGVNWHKWHEYNPQTGVWDLTRNVMGDERDAFNLNYNIAITPWSNPSTTKLISGAESPTNISIELQNQNSAGDITVKIHSTYASSLTAPPSKPQSIKLTRIKKTTTSAAGATVMAEPPVTIYNPKISWTANPEPNITGYEIWVREGATGSGWLLATVSSTTTSYIDYGNILNSSSGQIDYWVKAKNGAGKTSLASGIVSTNGDLIYKDGSEEEKIETAETIPSYYSLLQNYPNPFNPTTTISFDIPEEANISLKVYDMLGAEVAILSEGHMLAGRHTVNFNGSNLASGIYIYKFNATSLENGKHFQKINKMMLLK